MEKLEQVTQYCGSFFFQPKLSAGFPEPLTWPSGVSHTTHILAQNTWRSKCSQCVDKMTLLDNPKAHFQYEATLNVTGGMAGELSILLPLYTFPPQEGSAA